MGYRTDYKFGRNNVVQGREAAIFGLLDPISSAGILVDGRSQPSWSGFMDVSH